VSDSPFPAADCFALLEIPRCPWIDADALKQRFLARSTAVHPDRFHGADEATREAAGRESMALNTAHETLRETRDRLLHLIELETGGKPRDIQKIPPGTMDLFVEVGQACRSGDEFLTEKATAVSPMLKLRLMQAGLEWIDRFQGLQARVNARRDELDAELRSMNAAWETAPPPGDPARPAALPLERLETVYRAMSYIARWSSQIQERLVRLSE
jgi:hypothetical protein